MKKDNDKSSRLSRYSLARRIRMILLFMIILMSLSFIVSIYYIVKRERRETVMRESSTILNTLSDSISSDIERYKELSRLIMLDQELVGYLKIDEEEIDAGMINTVRYSVLNILNVTSLVDSVFAFRNDGGYIATNRGRYMFDHNRMNSDEWLEDILAQKGGAVISVNGNNALFKTDGSPIVTIARTIYDINTQRKLGLMFMNISSTFLEVKINNLADNDILIIGSDGTYLAGDRNIVSDIKGMTFGEEITHSIINGNLYSSKVISGLKVAGMPIYVITLSHTDNGIIMYETVYIMLFLLLIFSLAVLIMGTFVTKQMTDPLLAVTDAMEKNRETGRLEKIEIDIPQNEIGVLKVSYNNMVEHINELFDDLIEKEKTLQKAEMRVLHEQIKPHFLYNSLETIGYLAMDAGAEEVHAALETLGSFYRNFLSKGDRIVPLRTEISIIRDYLSLQKLRYGDILNDEYDIAEDTNECLIPKLILQPVVENSIYHGIRLKGEKGTISIGSRLEEGILHITVKDTGVGMSQQQIDDIMAKANDYRAGFTKNGNTDDISSSGSLGFNDSFGLWGTISRIRGYCESDDVVSIRSEEGEYTEIEFRIPQKIYLR